MIITVELSGYLRSYSDPQTSGTWSGQLEENSTISDLLHLIGITKSINVLCTQNGISVSHDSPLAPCSTIVIAPFISGG
jgi:hypothetical protein